MKNTLETRLGIFFAMCLVVAVIILEMVGVAEYFKPGYRIHADFKSIMELKQGDLVKMAGVEVGRVERIALTNELVRVTMKIKKQEAQIRTDSQASIRFTGLMGQNFVAVTFGTPNSPRAEDGASLSTVEQSDLSSVMNEIKDAVSQLKGFRKDFSTDNLTSMFGPITHFMEQNSNHLHVLLGNARKVSDQIAEGKGTVGKLLYDDSLYQLAMTTVAGVQAGVSELRAVASDARGLVSDVNAGKGNLGLLLRDDALYRESTNAMTNVREIMQKVNQGQGTVGKLVNDESFYKNVKVSLQKLDKAAEGLEDQGPLSVLGVAVGALF
jgi:phospholipid/cholesterol/gamma-HCH transport system substrate-binding protein